MFIVFELILFFLIIISVATEKSWKNPVSVFSIYWMILTMLAFINPYGMDIVSDKTFLLVFVGVFSFQISGLLYFSFVKNNKKEYVHFSFRKTSKTYTYGIRKKMVYVLCLMSIALFLPTAINGVMSLKNGLTFLDIRSGNTLDVVSRSGSDITAFLRGYILRPFTFALMPLGVIQFLEKDRNKIIMWSSLIISALLTLSEGGRANIFYLVLHFLVISQFYRKRKQLHKEAKKKRKIVFVCIIALVLLLIVITKSRGSIYIIKSLYIYFPGSLHHMTKRIESLEMSGLITYGTSSLYGYVTAIDFLFRHFGIQLNGISVVQNLMDWLEVTVSIGGNARMNAFVTAFFFLYADGRWFGVIMGSILYSLIVCNSYRKAVIIRSPKYICIFSMLMQGLLMSMVRMQFSTLFYALSFLFIPICFCKSNKLEKKKCSSEGR